MKRSLLKVQGSPTTLQHAGQCAFLVILTNNPQQNIRHADLYHGVRWEYKQQGVFRNAYFCFGTLEWYVPFVCTLHSTVGLFESSR